MKCGFHPKKDAVKKARPINLTYWTPICRACDKELGASWGRVPLRHKGLSFAAPRSPEEK
jgi:hypothetical protein